MLSKRMLYLMLVGVLLLVAACSQAAEEGSEDVVAVVVTEAVVVDSAESNPTATPLPIPTPEPAAAVAPDAPVVDDAPAPFVIGVRDVPGERLLAELTAAMLRQNDIPVTLNSDVADVAAGYSALADGTLDLFWEYPGAALVAIHDMPADTLPADPLVTWQTAVALDEVHTQLVWLEPVPFRAAQGLLIRAGSIADGLSTLDGLAAYMTDNDAPLTVCVDAGSEGDVRLLADVQAAYGFAFADENVIDVQGDQLYESLRERGCHVALASVTDARVQAWAFQPLDDTRDVFSATSAAALVRPDLATQFPKVADLLTRLLPLLDNPTLAQIDGAVRLGPDGVAGSGDEESAENAMATFLTSASLIGDRPRFVVGSIDSPEYLLLGSVTAQMLRQNGYEVSEIIYSGAKPARDAILAGEADVIWDNTARGLTQFHNMPLTAIPQASNEIYEMIASLDKRHADLVWLAPSQFDGRLVLLAKNGPVAQAIGSMANFPAFVQTSGAQVRVCVDEYGYGHVLPLAAQFYGIRFPEENILISDQDQVYQNLRDDACQLAVGRTIDGRIPAWGLLRIPDSSAMFPFTNAAPIMTQANLDTHPDLPALLQAIGNQMETETISLMIARIELGPDGVRASGDEEAVADVALDFLTRTGLLAGQTQLRLAVGPGTTQALLAHLSALLLNEGEIAVLQANYADEAAAYAALGADEADVTWQWTGAVLQNSFGEAPTGDAAANWQRLAELDAPNGVTWPAASVLQGGPVLLVNPASALTANLRTVDDVAATLNEGETALRLCVTPQFVAADRGLAALEGHYGFGFSAETTLTLPPADLYAAVRDGRCDVAQGEQTDSRIAALGLRPLADTRGFFAASSAAPVLRQSILDAEPAAGAALSRLAERIDNDTLRQLSARVELGADGQPGSGDEESAASVARIYLCDAALITDCFSAPTVSADPLATSEDAPTETAEADAPAAQQPAGVGQDNCETLSLNGSFEDDTAWQMPLTASTASYSTAQRHSGAWSMQIGFEGRASLSGFSAANQLVNLPENARSAEISFWYLPLALDAVGGDRMGFYIYDRQADILHEQHLLPLANEQAWIQNTYNLSSYLGESVLLHFFTYNDGDGVPTSLFLDDVVVRVCY